MAFSATATPLVEQGERGSKPSEKPYVIRNSSKKTSVVRSRSEKISYSVWFVDFFRWCIVRNSNVPSAYFSLTSVDKSRYHSIDHRLLPPLLENVWMRKSFWFWVIGWNRAPLQSAVIPWWGKSQCPFLHSSQVTLRLSESACELSKLALWFSKMCMCEWSKEPLFIFVRWAWGLFQDHLWVCPVGLVGLQEGG